MNALTRILTCLLAVAVAMPGAVAANAARLAVEALDLGAGPSTAQPSVAVDPGRGFVVTWQRRDGDRATLEFADIASDGAVRRRGLIADSATTDAGGGAARWFVNWADFPSLVVLDNGDWVAHWLQKTGAATYAYEVRVVRSRDRGATWSAPVVPHRDGTATEHGFVSLLPAGGDRVRVAWLDGRDTAGSHGGEHAHHGGAGAMTLRSAVLDGEGRITDETRLDARTCDCCQTDAVRAGGRAIVAWRDRGEDEVRDIRFAVHDGKAWGEDALVHADGWRIEGCPVNGPALAAGPAGVLAAWPTMQGEALHVRAAVLRGATFGTPLDLERGDGVLGRVDAAPWGRSRFLVAWLGAGAQAGAFALKLGLVDARPRLIDVVEVVALPPGRSTGVPRIAAADGVGLLAWVEPQAGSTVLRAALLRD